MKKDLKDITEEEVRIICEIYGEPFLSFLAGKWTFGLAVSISTTSTLNNSNDDSSIAIYYNGKITLTRNNGNWGGMREIDINPLITIDYLRSRGYEFKYEIPIKLERKLKLKNINDEN